MNYIKSFNQLYELHSDTYLSASVISMDIKKKIKFLESAIRNLPNVESVELYEFDFLDENHNDCFWYYGMCIATVYLEDGREINVSSNGELKGSFFVENDGNDESRSYKGNELVYHAQLRNLTDGKLYGSYLSIKFENNNWFDFLISDGGDTEYMDYEICTYSDAIQELYNFIINLD